MASSSRLVTAISSKGTSHCQLCIRCEPRGAVLEDPARAESCPASSFLRGCEAPGATSVESFLGFNPTWLWLERRFLSLPSPFGGFRGRRKPPQGLVNVAYVGICARVTSTSLRLHLTDTPWLAFPINFVGFSLPPGPLLPARLGSSWYFIGWATPRGVEPKPSRLPLCLRFRLRGSVGRPRRTSPHGDQTPSRPSLRRAS